MSSRRCTTKFPEVQAEFEGLVPLGFHVSDFFNLHIHKDVEPVRTLEDLQKLEIGAFSKSGVTYSELLGATPRNIKLEDPLCFTSAQGH